MPNLSLSKLIILNTLLFINQLVALKLLMPADTGVVDRTPPEANGYMC